MPASRRTAGPRTAFPAGSRHDAIRLKPAFTGRHHMNARLGVHNQVNLDPSTLGSKAAQWAGESGRRTRRGFWTRPHTARLRQDGAATNGPSPEVPDGARGAVRFTLPSASAPRARRAARRDGLLTGGGSVQRLAAGVIPFEPDSAATFEFQGRRELRCLSRGERHSLTFKPFLARRSFPQRHGDCFSPARGRQPRRRSRSDAASRRIGDSRNSRL